LTLVRHLVELHGGTIEALSHGRGKGAEFILSLPGAKLAARSPSRNPEGPGWQPGYSAKVLVVDDVMASAESLKQLLELEGHRVSVATDGHGALAMAQSFHPDVILLDIGLPGMSGFQVAKALRASGGFADTLLVALTGYGAAEDRSKGVEAGFNHYLVKPADIPTLLSIIGAQATLRQVADRTLSPGAMRKL
jgi:CheY-like chemotaxis protein